jgi:acyl carrier protein
VHLKDKGYHFYEAQLSWDCRLETLTREEGVHEITGFKVDSERCHKILNEIGYYKSHHGCAVLNKTDKKGENYLCAYVVAEKEFNAKELKAYLLQNLPDYMVPAHYVQMDELPLSASGKIDKKSLTEPQIITGVDYVAPRNKLEEKIVQIWSELLNVNKEIVGIDNNFFELGGHSLSVTSFIFKMHKEFEIKIPLVSVFKNPTIRSLTEILQNSIKENYISIEPANKKPFYALSSAQKRLYFIYILNKKSIAYNVPVILKIDTSKIDKLKSIFRRLIERHESLRTSFDEIGEEPVQTIHEKFDFNIEVYEINESEIDHIIKRFVRPFNLNKAPLIRVGLIKCNENKNYLMIDIHHIITDGLSNNILIEDFLSLYNESEVPDLKLSYKDFSEWQNAEKEREVFHNQKLFWLKQFENGIPKLNLPTDYKRPKTLNFIGKTLIYKMDDEVVKFLKDIIRNEDVTMFMLILTILNILFSKLTNQEDIMIGVPVSGRRHADLENIVGMFVNTLILRNYPEKDITFKEFLVKVKMNALLAQDNQDYQFEDLVNDLKVKRELNRNPLFDIKFMMGIKKVSEDEIQETINTPHNFQNMTSKFDISIDGIETENNFYLIFEYCSELFKQRTIDKLFGFCEEIIKSLYNGLDTKLSEIQLSQDLIDIDSNIFEKQKDNFNF